jgi:uncharacterized membrane protein YfcA
MSLSFILPGFIVGALVGLTGIGGGSVMTPMLILIFGINPISAVGTDLLFAAVTKATGSRVHANRGNVDWAVVTRLAAGSVPGASLTIILLASVAPQDPLSAQAIRAVVGVAVLFAAAALLLGRTTDAVMSKISLTVSPHFRLALTVVVGFLLGVVVSLTSLGAGAAGVVVIRQLYPDLPSVRLVGSDIAHAVPLTLLAGTGHWLIGDVQWAVLASLLLGSIPGIILASHLAHYLREDILRRVLGLVLLPTAVAMLLL